MAIESLDLLHDFTILHAIASPLLFILLKPVCINKLSIGNKIGPSKQVLKDNGSNLQPSLITFSFQQPQHSNWENLTLLCGYRIGELTTRFYNIICNRLPPFVAHVSKAGFHQQISCRQQYI